MRSLQNYFFVWSEAKYLYYINIQRYEILRFAQKDSIHLAL